MLPKILLSHKYLKQMQNGDKGLTLHVSSHSNTQSCQKTNRTGLVHLWIAVVQWLGFGIPTRTIRGLYLEAIVMTFGTGV